MQNGACKKFWCWEPILQQEGTSLQFSGQSTRLGPWSCILHSCPTNHIVWITVTLPAWISLCLKGENANFFFKKLYGRWLLCLIRTSSLIITQTEKKIQISKNFLDSAINFVDGMFCIGSVTNWKTIALFEPHFLPSYRAFQFHSATDSGGGRAEGRREVMILAATPLWFAKIAAWKIWFLKYLMFC